MNGSRRLSHDKFSIIVSPAGIPGNRRLKKRINLLFRWQMINIYQIKMFDTISCRVVIYFIMTQSLFPSRFDLQHLQCKVFGYLLIRRTNIWKILSLLIKDMKRKLCWGILCLNSNKPMLWFNSTALEKIYIRKDCGLGFLWVKLSETFSLRILIKIDFSYSIIN